MLYGGTLVVFAATWQSLKSVQVETWSLLVSIGAVVVSAISLMLTQAPPISHWSKGAKTDLRLSKSIYLTHRLADPTVVFTLDATNVGGRTTEINGVDCIFEKSTGEIMMFPVQSIELGGNSYQFAEATIKPQRAMDDNGYRPQGLL